VIAMRNLITISFVFIITILISICSSVTYNVPNLQQELSLPTLAVENTSSNFYEDLDKLPQEYTLEMAIQNGDVVSLYGRVYNFEKFDKFYNSYKSKELKTGDKIRIIRYTVEGDAIIQDLIYSEEGLKLIKDNKRDKFANSENRKKKEFKITDITIEKSGDKTSYKAKPDIGEELPLITFRNIGQ